MKTVNHLLVGAMLIGLAVDVNTNLSAPAAARPTPADYVLKRIPFGAVHHQQARHRIRLADNTSGNWSGYAVPYEAGGVSDTFSDVTGTWIAPAVGAGTKSSAAYTATWVGLDGYDNGTVEQIGTEQDWTGRAQQNYAWFEMYPSGAWELNPSSFPVTAGDTITASVSFVGQTSVQVGRNRSQEVYVFNLTITDTTVGGKKWTFSTYPNYASYSTTTSAARASAEWIVEAPYSREILPLANFGTALFSNCEAIGKNGVLSSITAWPWDDLTMVDPEGGVATPSALSGSGEAFSDVWSK